jgi:transcriptional antiterminator NusG
MGVKPMSDSDKKWYVIHTLSGQEQKVKETLESKIRTDEMTDFVEQILIPTENVSEVKAGKKTISKRKFFPGYVLAKMALTDEVWYFIKGTPGVIGFVGSGKPVPLQDKEVAEILSQIEEKKEKVKPKVLFEKGETVKVNDGPFVNFSGVIDDINPDKGKLKVMVSIFGRATPVELEYWQVERQ